MGKHHQGTLSHQHTHIHTSQTLKSSLVAWKLMFDYEENHFLTKQNLSHPDIECPQWHFTAFCLIAEQLSWQMYNCAVTFLISRFSYYFCSSIPALQMKPYWILQFLRCENIQRTRREHSLHLRSARKSHHRCAITVFIISEAKERECARKPGFHFSAFFCCKCQTHCWVSPLAGCLPHIWSCRLNHRSQSILFSSTTLTWTYDYDIRLDLI